MKKDEYIPYSVRHSISVEDIWNLANYLERVMWEEVVMLSEWDETFIWLDKMSIILYKDKARIIDNAKKEILLEIPRVCFLNLFEVVLPELRDYLSTL